jgi:3-dehydroquinate synthase
MTMAARLSQRLGLMAAADVQRLNRLVQTAGLPVVAPRLAAPGSDETGRWLELMAVDKKAEAGSIRYVLIDGLGRAVLRPVPEGDVRAVIAEAQALAA